MDLFFWIEKNRLDIDIRQATEYHFNISNANIVRISFHFTTTDSFDGEAVFRVTSRNAMSVVYNNYTYYKHRRNASGADYWVCRKRVSKRHKCRARLYSMQVGNKHVIKVINDKHSHESDLEDE